jgi:type 1 glutamine amidotransferase
MRLALLLLFALPVAIAAEPMKALIIDGQNNHDWKTTTPLLKKYLEQTGLFTVDVSTTPPKGQPMDSFAPNFAAYRLVVLNYNGDPWPESVNHAFEKYMREGGGMVSYHAADNAFPAWEAFNEMIGLGGWGGRNELSGPTWPYSEGKWLPDHKRLGAGGHHGKQHPFQVVTRDPKHPIMKGLPERWMHATDELYDSLRGVGMNMGLLATSYSAPEFDGTGLDEPSLFTIKFGKGRVFHTTLGHGGDAVHCVGFIVTLQRGAEWAATGQVTQKVPDDFPTAEKVSLRP